jgi:putative transposase
MPRRPRLHVPGGLYHAVLRGNHRQAIFDQLDDYLCFEQIVARAVDRYAVQLLAYCWMTNHVHFAIRIAEAPLGATMSIIASRYARAKQRRLTTTGHLFERRYRARLVDADRYLLALVRYIHLNPVRAGIVSEPRDYRWSSHRAYLGAPRPWWLYVEPVLAAFSPTADAACVAYRRFMQEAPAESERDEISVIARPGQATRPDTGSLPNTAERVHRPAPHTLEGISAEVAAEFGVALEDVLSKRRHSALVHARKEIARRALREGTANLSEIARHVRRAPSTLSELLGSEQQ